MSGLSWAIIGFLALGLGLACLSLSRWRYTSITPMKKSRAEWMIKTELVPGPVARLFGVKTIQIDYVGSGKVWYELPDRERCDLKLGKRLFDQWKKERRRRARLKPR